MVLNVDALQQRVSSPVLTPEHPDYDATRRAWSLVTDHYPASILVAENARDIAAGLHFARETGLGVAIQLTGHGIQQQADDALLIVTKRLNSVSVDPARRTATVEAGVLWSQVVDAAAPYGLAPLLGSAPHVGVVGYTLGGGMGWLVRKYGLAADSVRWIEIVTPDGVLRRASSTENADLFWGLLGGGGNFGVVTAMEFDLYPVPTLYGGHLLYPGEVVGDALRFFRDWAAHLPEELTASIQMFRLPALPIVPEEMRGKLQVFVRAAYAGDAADGARWIQPWLAWRQPLENTFAELPFREVGRISNDPKEPSAGYGSNETVNALSDGLVDTIVQRMSDSANPVGVTELRHVAGAMARIPADANAIANRDAQFFLQMGAFSPTPEVLKAVKGAMRDYKQELRPYLRGGVYLNFMKGEEAAERVRDGYLPAAYERLVALKAKYDPDNLFRYSYQIVPMQPTSGN